MVEGGIIKKLKENHMLLMAICCIVPLLLGFMAISYFGVDFRNYSWLFLLLCPLMMVWMMKDMHPSHGGHAEKANPENVEKVPSKAGMKNELPAKKEGQCH